MHKKYRNWIIGGLFLAVMGILLTIDPIPQDPNYHNFADKRSFWGIANFWDVVSNIPMGFIGIYGLTLSLRNWRHRPDLVAKLIPTVLCIGMFSVCFGSAFYHLAPTNTTLVWDRLPMTFIFMSLFSLLIYDFIGKRAGEIAFWLLIPLGVFSVFYWQYTENIGQGDLRLYAFVQFAPMFIVPFILFLFPKKNNYLKYITYLLFWYVGAKFAEHFDPEIYATLGFWSGHTIKHLLSAVSLVYVLKLVQAWEKPFLPATNTPNL
jgi:hypothetical protein